MIGYEARSAGGSLLTINVYSLVGADPAFVAGLPQSIVPQLEAWTLYYFVVVGSPETREATIGGAAALETSYTVRVRPPDPPSKAEYWVVRNGDLLYLLRAIYPPSLLEAESRDVRALLASWTFLPASAPRAKPLPLGKGPA